MAVIEFRTLGTLDLRRADGAELHSLLAQPKRVALLAYLCLATPRGFHRRDTLLGLFWPDADQTHARTSLRNALHALRHSLGETAFHSRGDEEVAVNFDAIWCDAAAFEERLASDKVDDALELYRGDLLTGFFLEDVPTFERWLESERSRLRACAARAARVAAERRELERNLTGAVSLARRAVELTDPDERAVRRLLELLVRVGDRAGALQAYENFARHLAAEFEAQPSAETRAVVERPRSPDAPARQARSNPSDMPVEVQFSLINVPGYSIERELGRGATSTVFLARDLKHDRPVAVKILRADVVAVLGPDRFLAEIAIAARLHHPHILPLLDSGAADGLPYYVMPRVEGETLRSRLRREKFLPIDDAIRIACEIADALGHAHARGIIHRDIKPENILFDNGHALVADFGIARAISKAGGKRLTQTGLALGTAAYMSPEQADTAVQLDGRVDIYALGCVLYEMLTGDPPFLGSTAQAILARKAAEPAPPMRAVRDTISPSLESTVMKALSRVPADRFRTVNEFAVALGSPSHTQGLSTPRGNRLMQSRDPRAIRIAAIIGAAIVGTAVILLAAKKMTQPRSAPPVARQITYSGRAFKPAISPDRQFLAYVAEEGDSLNVIVQDLASGGIPNTVATITDATTIEWSPDGTMLVIGSFDPVRSRGLAFTVPRTGGERRPIAAASAIAANVFAYWIPDSLSGESRVSLHADPDKRVLIVNLRTEDTVAVPVHGDYDALFDGAWSPGGALFAVATMSVKPVEWAIRIAGRDGTTEVVVQDSVALGSPRWSPSGDAVYYARGGSSVWRVPVSPRTGERQGIAKEMNGQLEVLLGNYLGLPHFAVTPDGRRMAYANGRRYSNLWWVETGGAPRATALTSGTALRWSPVVSPDGNWIAFAQETAGVAELFRMPVGGGRVSQMTFGARVRPQTNIAWSPDGGRVAFGSVRHGDSQVWLASVENGQLSALHHTDLSAVTGHLAWAPSSRIVYQSAGNKNVHVVDPATGEDRAIRPVSAWGLFQRPRFAPDGNRIAVAWNRGAGDLGVWIFDLTGSSRERKIAAGWLWPIGWSADSRYVYASLYSGPTVYRIDSRGARAPEAILRPSNGWRGLGRNSPVREMECSPAGRLRPDTFICAAFDFVSDIWMIDNFDQRAK